MPTALVTGVTGQDGSYLAEFLLDKGYNVIGMVRRTSTINFDRIRHIQDRIEIVQGDLLDQVSLINLLQQYRPDEVYNLAAQSFVGSSWDQATLTTNVNSLGVLYLLNAIKNYVPNARFYQASTSEMFGNSHDHGIQTEDTPFHPRSPYAISKLYAHWITVNYRESYNLFCSSGILFNHESPIRGIEFVTRKISDGVARIKLGRTTEIRLGNLDSERDWGFAGDYVDAMWRMLQQENPDNFIVSTGENHSIRDFLDIAFHHVGIPDWQPYVKIDPRYKRPAELFSLRGQSDKARKVLGWKPMIEFKTLVEMMVDADIKRLL